MRYIILLYLLLFGVSLSADTKQSVTVGLGSYIQTQPYKDVLPIVVPSPVIFFDNSIFYIRWSRFGLYFLGKKEKDFAWGLSLTIEPRTYGYRESDSTILYGMESRHNGFEGGLALSASFGTKYIESMLLSDIINRHDTWIFKTEIGDSYHFGEWSFYPSLIAIYQSQKFLNYYYGVKHSEAIENIRASYRPSGGILFGMQSYIRHPITKNLATLLNLRANLIPQTAVNSPIVNKRFIYSGLLSLIYKFEK